MEGVAAATNLVGNLVNGDLSGAWFAIVQVVGAVVWGVGFRRWFGRSWLRFVAFNVATGLACTLVAVPIILFAFGGASTLEGANALGGAMQQLGLGLVDAVASANLLTSMVDKLVSGFAALGVLVLLARSDYPLPAGIPERLRRLRPGMR